MSESLAFAGKLLAPFAKPAAKKVASRLGFDRWRIARAVGSATGITFPQPEFRSWLKGLTQRDFEEPVESASPRLAIALDGALAAAGDSWTRKPGRASTALRLVEATYASLLAVVDDKSARGLMTQWAKHRNEAVLTRLTELTLSRGGWGRLDGADLGFYLKRRSWERRAIRLEAVGVIGDARHAIIDILRPSLPDVPAGKLRALVGPFGAGKTEVAEAWHLACTEELLTDPMAPIPIWLYARDLRSENVERAVGAAMGSEELLRSRGAAVVIDGVDEVDGATADAIARDARVLVAGSPRTRILLTSRPHVIPETDEDLQAPELSEQQVVRLVESLGGPGVVVHSWPPALKDSTKRPFFALAAASSVAAGRAINGPAGLMRNLVELAVSRGTTQTVITAHDLFESLVELATRLTNSPDPVSLDFGKAQRILSTRLVTKTPSGSMQFSLPIFEQWFAAQRLVTDSATLDEALATRASFDRWRWAAAIALSGADGPQADALMTKVLALNPGAAGWLLEQVRSGYSLDQEQPDSDFATVSSRLLTATRAWVNSLGPLAELCFPIHRASSGIRLGLRISDSGSHHRAWSTEPADVDEVLPLPKAAHPFAPPTGGWTATHSGHPPAGSAWPWLSVQRDIASQLLSVLESEKELGGSAGVWSDELMYHWCRVILGNTGFRHAPMAKSEVKEKIDQLLSLHTDPDSVRFVFGRHSMDGANLPRLSHWVDEAPGDAIQRPVPAPDRPLDEGPGFIWDVYSNERLVRLAADIYGNACQAYDEIAAMTFPTFDWSLGRGAYAPIGVVGAVTRGSGGAWEDGPSIAYIQAPMSMVDELSSVPGYVTALNGRAAIKWASSEEFNLFERDELRSKIMPFWSEQARSETAPFGSLHSAHSIFETDHDRPASELAAKWLFDDLKRLALADGTVPNLNR